MLKDSSPPTLYRIDECPDLMVDGCLCDDQRGLIFLSLWGRDTAVQEFLARLTLGEDEKGLDQFHLITDEDLSIPVFAGNIERLEKRTARVFRQTLFGSMMNIWLIDQRCLEPDKANARALAILPKNAPNRTQRLWTLAQETCPFPLLDHWRDTVLELLQSQEMLSPLSFALGPIEGYRLAVDVPAVTETLGELIRNDCLGLSPQKIETDAELRRVA